MRLTRYGHSCVLVEDGDARVLLDPGVFSSGFEDLRGLTGVLVTHQHADHLDLPRVTALLEANPEARLLTDSGSDVGDLPRTVVGHGDAFDLGVPVSVHGSDHAVIHPDIPGVPNVGYLVGSFFTPGDALTVPDADVEVLGLPTDAPWLKLSEAVTLLREVQPHRAFPVHDGVLNPVAAGIWYGHFDRLSPSHTTFTPLLAGESLG